ncbi:hypothetical protein [Actinospica robiniae]|uniref:hypothetical protein n=1 Tax=Actinospica robiniae TaxID=304901 RepID=UPI0012F90F08|nr:hypothetical protein [Actinospica robiniae]
MSAPAAFAAESPRIPDDIKAAINSMHLNVQVNDGWEAVTGPASSINDVRAVATADHFGTIADYTGSDETGRAILIFTGNDHDAVGFRVSGATFSSEANDTDQPWYVYEDNDTLDAIAPAGTAENIPPVDMQESSTRERRAFQPIDLIGPVFA